MVESLASLCAIALVLSVVDGKPTTTSLDIARHFNRPHDEVLRRIRNLLAQLDGERLRNFAESFHEVPGPNGATIKHPAYRITRDGFTLLAMGFTGKKALQFKLAYIDAFNTMEAQIVGLHNSANPAPSPALLPQKLMADAVLTGMASGTMVQNLVTQAVLKGTNDWMHQRYLVSFITDSKHGNPPVVELLPADAVVLQKKYVSALMGEAFANAWLAVQKQVDQQTNKGART